MGAPKLSPEDRLRRKREAARLRQQRCRARKREAAASGSFGKDTGENAKSEGSSGNSSDKKTNDKSIVESSRASLRDRVSSKPDEVLNKLLIHRPPEHMVSRTPGRDNMTRVLSDDSLDMTGKPVLGGNRYLYNNDRKYCNGTNVRRSRFIPTSLEHSILKASHPALQNLMHDSGNSPRNLCRPQPQRPYCFPRSLLTPRPVPNQSQDAIAMEPRQRADTGSIRGIPCNPNYTPAWPRSVKNFNLTSPSRTEFNNTTLRQVTPTPTSPRHTVVEQELKEMTAIDAMLSLKKDSPSPISKMTRNVPVPSSKLPHSALLNRYSFLPPKKRSNVSAFYHRDTAFAKKMIRGDTLMECQTLLSPGFHLYYH